MDAALYYPWMYLKSGGERTIAEIIRRSRHRWTVFTNRFERESTFPELATANVVELPTVSVKRTFGHAAAAAWQIAGQKLPLQRYQALLVLCEGLGDFITFRNHEIPVLALCFTPLRAAFDPYYQAGYLAMHRHAWLRRPALYAGAAAFKVVDRLAWKHYAHVMVISEEVRRRVERGRLCSREKLSINPPGVDLARLKPCGVYEKKFVICGRIMWTKNVELGIDAFKSFLARRPDHSDFKLTIAGFVDRKSKPYIARLRERARDCPNIEFLESPPDEALFGVMKTSYALLYPPFNEDWGLMPIEAGALGKPVIATNRGGPRETVRDGITGFLVEPRPEAFATAMEWLADDPALARSMGDAGQSHAQQFGWDQFAGNLDAEMERVVAGESWREPAGERESLAGKTTLHEAPFEPVRESKAGIAEKARMRNPAHLQTPRHSEETSG